jgi:hypothetical protein
MAVNSTLADEERTVGDSTLLRNIGRVGLNIEELPRKTRTSYKAR